MLEKDILRKVNKIDDIDNNLKKSVNTKYTTVNGVKEFECKDGYVDNVKIEGKTLVNLANCNNVQKDVNATISNNIVTVSGNGIWSGIRFLNLNMLKADTDYTLVTIVTQNTLNGDFYTSIKNAYNAFDNDVKLSANSVGTFVSKIRTKSAFTTQVGLSSQSSNLATSGSIKLQYILLEGDYTQNPPAYFEGLKSVDQGDKLEVLTYGDKIPVSFKDGYYVVGSTGIEVSSSAYSCTDYIQIDDKLSYIAFLNPNSAFYDINKVVIPHDFRSGTYIKPGGNIGDGISIVTPPKDAKYMRISISTSNKSKFFISHKYDKKQISTTLRGMKDDNSNWITRDEIEPLGNGGYRKIKRCVEVTLNGDENWVDSGVTTNNNRYLALNGFHKIKIGRNFAHCDRFKVVLDFDKSIECIHVHETGFNVSINTSKANDLQSFKTWLKSNPVTIVYELETPIITELPNFNTRTFADKTTFLCSSGVVQCEASFEVTNSLGSSLDVIGDMLSSLYESTVNLNDIKAIREVL